MTVTLNDIKTLYRTALVNCGGNVACARRCLILYVQGWARGQARGLNAALKPGRGS